jgi:hypothetical protein
MPMRVLRQCLRFALYLHAHSLAICCHTIRTNIGSAHFPNSSEVAIPDGVARPQSDPLWDRSVLLLRFGELLLRSEGLVGLQDVISKPHQVTCDICDLQAS